MKKDQFILTLHLETPERKKYVAGKAKDYIVKLMDGREAKITEGKRNHILEILSKESVSTSDRIEYSGTGVIDEKAGLYAFYAEYAREMGKVGRPIFIGRIVKWRRHIPNDYSLQTKGWKTYKPLENKLYFVSNKWEPSGFYVIAKTPEAARNLVHSDLDCDYIDSRARRVRFKDEWRLGEYRENIVIEPDDTHILNHLGIEYSEPEER